uniref:cardiac-enriched FHL2-interacting protein n=1 Tax=Euleptes europaea TaxID=460621 RepID=UPI00254023A5|nr:cardiac-enriched FHL2-interacting protein [Euleptes europaea]
MQGNKKHTDGQSDSSSIGSLLDETDREVCSLTDRAFKSLCLDELETSYPEADPAVSPRIQHPFSNKHFQGPRNHAIKKNAVSNKLLPKTEEHPTFQQLPKDTQEEKKAVTNTIPNIRRKLGLPVPNLHHYKHTSKVSSLIKTFNKAENQEAPAIAAQPVKNNLSKFPLICGANMALWGSKTILHVPKELSQFSGVGDAQGRPEMHKRLHKPMDLLCQGPPRFYSVPAAASNKPQSGISTLSNKILKNRIGKAKELAGKGSFLHSENSAFESWNAHHKKLTRVGGSTECTPTEENLAYLEETPYFEESYMSDRKPSPLETADSVVLEQDFSSDVFPQNPLSQISLSPVSLGQSPCLLLSKARDPLIPPSSGLAMSADRIPTPPPLPSKLPFSRALGPQVVASPVPISRVPVPLPYLPQTPLPCEADSPNADTHVPLVTSHPEKTKGLERDPELGKVCPPWRRQKMVLRGMELAVDVAREGGEMKDSIRGYPSDVISLADVAATDSHITSSDASSPSFNITQLLTPLIPPRQEKEPSNSPLLTPPLSEAEAATEPEERTFHRSQNDYKSKASSLLFNLKDIRKRVKSTYSPAPLLRAFEEKKKIKEPDGLKGSGRNLLEGNSSKSGEKDETSEKPLGNMGSTREKARTAQLKERLLGDYRTLSPPSPKADRLGYQQRNSLPQENSVDFEDAEMVSDTELHPKDNSRTQCPPSSQMEQDMYRQNVALWDPKTKRGSQSHPVDVGPRESPTLFFTVEENVNDSASQACPESGNEQKDKRSTSSSEQSFVSIVDLPSHEESFSLMQLFQKACLQESKRNQGKGSAEEKPSNQEGETSGRPEEASHDHGISNYNSKVDGKSNGKVEQNKEENTPRERLEREKREGREHSLDLVTEGKSEEPPTPTLSISFKPNLFKIKDNTFKSPPVIKTVKLPLFRSLSCDGAIAGGYRESERQACGPFRTTPVIQETDWPLSRNRRQHRTWKAAAAKGREADESRYSPARTEEDNLAAESTFQEELGSFYEQQPVEDDEGMAFIPGIVQNKDKDHEEQLTRGKGNVRTRKLRPSSTSQLHLEVDLVQNEIRSPTREKTNYYKNNPLSKRRSGSCMKKVITREARSPATSETQAYSPAFSDAFGDTLCTAILTSSNVPSPRSDCTMHSAFTSLLSDTTATCSTAEAEKTATSSSLHRGSQGNDNPSTAETSEPMQMSQLSGHMDSSPGANERPQLMRQMVKTAAKPPAVPPKTEKALRRAKKLANRRKKIEAQQKKPLVESLLPREDITPLPSAQSPLLPAHLSSPVMSSEPNQVTLPPIPSSPTPSSPATQRKLLQDPDSGEYFMVDLPTQFKTLYDPESGKYIQVSLPSSKRNSSQMPSSEILAPPYVLYPSALPLRVSSVQGRASPSQLSEPASLVQGALSESAPDWQQDGRYLESLNSQPYLESAVSEDHTREADGPLFNFERDMGLSDKTDIISLGAIEDFAVEGIS